MKTEEKQHLIPPKSDSIPVIMVDDNNFIKEVKNYSGLTLVEFHTGWCGACHILAPVIRDAMSKYSDIVKFCQVDFENNPKIINRYNVRKLPTIMIFYNGRVVDVIRTIISKKVLQNKIKILLRNIT